MKRWMVCAVLALVMLSGAAARAALRVDVNPKSDRKDILSKDCENWMVSDGLAATQKFGAVTITLRPWGMGATMAGQLYKGGLDTGATMATDGVIVKGGSAGGIELVLSGLAAGKHSIVTYHNALNAQPAGGLTVSIADQHVMRAVTPSHRVASDDDAASAYLEFAATAGQDVVVTIGSASGKNEDVFLNGFELDTVDPAKKALHIFPAEGDEHVAANPTLTWRPAATEVSHDVYFGTSGAAVGAATHESPEFRGNQKGAAFATDAGDSWQDYFWRVDEVCSDAPAPIKGDVHRFRIQHLAFPGAEGYGRFAIGGRGGRVYEVTNLDDSGPGSLREAVEATGPRMVVFRVGGTIELKSKLVATHPYITVSGQTAPGDGILLKGFTSAAFGTHDVIWRYLRIRVGDESGVTLDGCGLGSCDNCIVDHCSISWSIDESFSSRGAHNITLQRTIISEALNMSIHDHYIGTGKGHSFAASISGDIGSFHHNLIVNCAGRNWSLAGGLNQAALLAGRLDIRNNVVYNWDHRTTDGGVKALDYENNLYIPGPATHFFHLLTPDAGTINDPQQYFMRGNTMIGHPEFDADNWVGAVITDPTVLGRIKLAQTPFPSYVTTQTPEEAYKSVIADVGANIPHYDAVDKRAMDDVTQRTTHFSGSKTGLPGIIDSQKDVGGYPAMKGGDAPVDSDHDGIPDAWETAHGLDPHDAADGARKGADGYSNLENYLNGIRAEH